VEGKGKVWKMLENVTGVDEGFFVFPLMLVSDITPEQDTVGLVKV
jgi:hypothetical protein